MRLFTDLSLRILLLLFGRALRCCGYFVLFDPLISEVESGTITCSCVGDYQIRADLAINTIAELLATK